MPTWRGYLYIPQDATIDPTQMDCQLRLNDGRTANILLDGPVRGEKVTFGGEGAPPALPPDGPADP